MTKQEDHDKPENLVEENQELEKDAAGSLEDAVDSHGSLEGYFAMNNVRDPETKKALELEREAKKKEAEKSSKL